MPILTLQTIQKFNRRQLQNLFKGNEHFLKNYCQITELHGRRAYLGAYQLLTKFPNEKWLYLMAFGLKKVC